ncbi:MAG: hypothetical protein C0480_12705 [Bradyrhizobium sp.]|nr:hypothetical protein [Bradyrhizobium sp.]
MHVVLPLAVFRAAGWIGSDIIMVPRAGMIKHTLGTEDVFNPFFLISLARSSARNIELQTSVFHRNR